MILIYLKFGKYMYSYSSHWINTPQQAYIHIVMNVACNIHNNVVVNNDVATINCMHVHT